jgi:hypothetical protein
MEQHILYSGTFGNSGNHDILESHNKSKKKYKDVSKQIRLPDTAKNKY